MPRRFSYACKRVSSELNAGSYVSYQRAQQFVLHVKQALSLSADIVLKTLG
jgi:hypothetical protein